MITQFPATSPSAILLSRGSSILKGAGKTNSMDAPEVIENLQDLTLTSREGFVSFEPKLQLLWDLGLKDSLTRTHVLPANMCFLVVCFVFIFMQGSQQIHCPIERRHRF